MKLHKIEMKRLEFILRKLRAYNDPTTEVMIVCPFPDRTCEGSCGVMFPNLLQLKNDKGNIVCPCFAMIDGHIPVKRVIRKVQEALNQGELIEQ